MLIDTHIHVPLMIDMQSLEISKEEHTRIQTMMREAHEQNVHMLITIGTTYRDSMQNIAIAQAFESIYAAIGIHPTEITQETREYLNAFNRIVHEDKVQHRRIIAIGECGIDLYHKTTSLSEQKDMFRRQIGLALQHNLALIIHSRDAAEETLRCLEEFHDHQLRGIVHCFSYDLSIALEFLQRNFVLGIGGTVTYPKNDILRHVMRSITLEDFVLETDAPFLPPQPWRGKKNHPQYIAYLADYLADISNFSSDSIAQQTTTNALRLFGKSNVAIDQIV